MIGNKIIQEDIQIISQYPLNWERFRNKVVFISGANGFLPSYMVRTLLYLNHKYSNFDVKVVALVRNIEKAKSRFSLELNNPHLEIIEQSVSADIIYNGQVDFIIHAASQASPKYYGVDPVGTLNANVIGTINLLKLAQKQNIESFLYFSSSEVYGKLSESQIPTSEHTFGEVDPTSVRSCYAESKRMGENICVSWFAQYGIPTKIVRPFHTYGPGMSLDDGRVYADFVADILANRNIQMASDGSARRVFCYLSDATVAFFKILLDGTNGEAYNMGNPECECSILELAQQLVQLYPEKGLQVIQIDSKNHNYVKSPVNRNAPNIEKINTLGWYPHVNICDGFKRTIESYINE